MLDELTSIVGIWRDRRTVEHGWGHELFERIPSGFGAEIKTERPEGVDKGFPHFGQACLTALHPNLALC